MSRTGFFICKLGHFSTGVINSYDQRPRHKRCNWSMCPLEAEQLSPVVEAVHKNSGQVAAFNAWIEEQEAAIEVAYKLGGYEALLAMRKDEDKP